MLVFAQRYKAFFDYTTDGILVFNLKHQILDANPRFITISEYAFDNLVSLTLDDLFNKDSIDLIKRKIKRLLESKDKDKYPFECILLSKKLKKKPVEIGLSLLEDQYGFSQTIFAHIRDITRRKEAERDLIQRAEELQKVFDAVPNMLCVIDEGKRIKKINLEGVHSFKKEEKDIIGKKIGKVIDCKYDGYSKRGCGFGEKCSECPINESILRCLKNNTSIRDVEVSIKTQHDKNEIIKYYQLNAIPFLAQGKKWGVVSLHDITARKKAELETEHLHKDIEHSNLELKKALDDLARSQSQLIESQKLQQIGLLSSGLAHNLKTPTAGIKGYAQLLHKKYPDSDEINMILEEVEIIDKIINDLMVKSRKEHSNQPEDINLNELIRIGLNFLSANLFFKNKIKKIIRLDESISHISGVYTHFSQSLMNIIQNAIDAMYNSEKKVLTIKTYQKKRHICIDIEDTGIGIPDNIINSVFDPFFTTKTVNINSNDDRPVGTGLGLSSASYFIRQYGGNIDISSTEGKGTKVTISFPLKSKMKESNRRVIIVEASQEMVDIFVQICRDMGIEAQGTTEGLKALNLYKDIKPALLIIDLSLPDFNGKELSEKVRKVNPKQKIIYMQGYSGNQENYDWLSLQCQKPLLSSVIKKPFSLDEFRKIIQHMLF